MATTHEFQVKPDFYTSAEICLQEERNRVNTNPRYRHFNQTHFTAGDIQQFSQYRDMSNGQVCIPDIDLKNNIYKDVSIPNLDWKKYINLSAQAVDNTFNYLFHKFKKGIFIKIKNGQLRVFLPFSNKNFVNEWSNKIHIDPKYGDLFGFIKYIQSLEGRRFFPKSINRFIDTWYSNNCLVRYEFPIHEGDSNNTNMSDMFRTLCTERDVPDLEFFVNRRDFPLLKRNGTEPYSQIYDTSNQPLLSHNYNQYAPVLSMVTAKDFADIPIPTGDDWSRVCRKEGKYFARSCQRSFVMESVPWNERKPIAVFRGGSTGCGVTVKTNPRLKLAYISSTQPRDSDGSLLLDAGITNWNLRPRKVKGQKYLQTIDIKNLPFGLVSKLTPQEQATYKYIVNVDGHVSAYRLSLELESGACILLANSKYKLWYRDLLKPWKHYVPVAHDLVDLVDKIKWCKKHDKKCKQIAENARKFAKTFLTKKGILDYLQNLIYNLRKQTGVYLYNQISVQELQLRNQRDSIEKKIVSQKTIRHVQIPQQQRSHGFFQGVGMILDKVPHQIVSKKELFNNKATLVTLCELGGFQFVKKQSSRSDEIINESFVTQFGTNKLLETIPNFAYVLSTHNDSVYMENVEGESLREYLKSDNFNVETYLFILLQISLALHTAQHQIGLVHWDLTPWNIVLHKLPQKTTFSYVIDYNTVYNVETDLVPIIIDMGRSHIIYKNNHYGSINIFTMSTIQDVLTLLVTSVYEITERRDLSSIQVNEIIQLSNFMSGTIYREEKFKYRGKNGLGDLRYFLRSAKKYTELLHRDKGELEKKTTLDFYNYILENSRYDFSITTSDKILYPMTRCNSRRVYEFSFAKTVQQKIDSFVKVFKRVRKCQLPLTVNNLLAKYTVLELKHNLHGVRGHMIKFLESVGRTSETYDKQYEKTIRYIDKFYSSVLDSKDYMELEYNVEKPISLKYTEESFLYPEKILQLVKQSSKYNDDNSLPSYKIILTHLLLDNDLSETFRDFYIKDLRKLLEIDGLQLLIASANVQSLRLTASSLYSANVDMINARLEESTPKENCTKAQKYLQLYRNVLELL